MIIRDIKMKNILRTRIEINMFIEKKIKKHRKLTNKLNQKNKREYIIRRASPRTSIILIFNSKI
jgi:hypothetical protein